MTAPTLSDIKTRLAAVQATISGVKRAYANAPASLPPDQLPVFLNFTGPCQMQKFSDSLAHERREFIMRLYVKPKGAGVDGEAEKAVEPYLARVRDAFLGRPMLSLGTILAPAMDYIEPCEWLGDSGVMILLFAEEGFIGAEFRLAVKTFVPIAFANYD